MNVTDCIGRYSSERPSDLALLTLTDRLDWFSLNNVVNAAAQLMHESGVRAGQRVAISVRDQVLHLFVSLGLARLGAAQIALPPIEPLLTRKALTSQLSISAVVIETSKDCLEGVQAIQVSADALRNAETSTRKSYDSTGSDVFLLLQSSGTTGNPKFSELTHEMAFERFDRYKTYFQTSFNDIFWPASSLDFVVAKQRVYHSLQSGAAVCIISGQSIDRTLLDFIDKQDVTIACGTPSHLVQILIASGGDKKLPKIRAFEVRSSTVTEELRRKFKGQITPSLFVAYATNEVEVACLARPEIQNQIADTVGCPVSDMKVEVVDEQGIPVPEGQAGSIRISGKGVITKYLDNPAATKKSFHNGWFYPGDLGRFEGGSLVFLGRSDDMMIFDGMNIYPVEIENTLMLHPAVSEVAALPLKHPQFEDIPVAAVILNSPISTDDLHAHCKRNLGIKSPHMIKVFDEFPKNAMGKTLKRDIRKVFEDGLGSVEQRREPLNHENNKQFLRFEFKSPKEIDAVLLQAWLKLLDGQLEHAMMQQHFIDRNQGQVWLTHVLAFAASLLHSLNVPFFDQLTVESCDPDTSVKGLWRGAIEQPDPRAVPPKVFQDVLQVAYKLAAWCSTADPDTAADREHFFHMIETDVRRTFAKVKSRGGSTFEVLQVAHHLNIPFYVLPGGIFQVGMGSTGCKIDRSTTNQDSAIGARWAKSKTLSAHLLRQGGLPAPRHLAANSIHQAQKASELIGFPLVVKPADLERGEGVTVDVEADNLEAAFNEAVELSPSNTALIEQQVAGVCHRLFVVDGALLYAVRRLPIGVYADGRSSIENLVKAECQAQLGLPPWRRSGISPLDELAAHALRLQGWTSGSVPEKGQFIALRRIETTAWGGVDEDVTKTIHRDNVQAAIEAAKLFGLQVAGVDIISQDITQPWHSNGAIINEVNYAPLLGGGEISRAHIPSFLKTLIRDGGRIPIHVYFGGREALEASKEKWVTMVSSGLRTALLSSQQTLLSDGQPKIIPLAGLYERCQALVLSPDIDAMVIAVQDDEFLYRGLPFDSVSVVQDVGGTLTSHREKRSLNEKEADNLREVLASWGRSFEAV